MEDQGPLAEEKSGPTDDEGRRQPQQMEVESARQLENDAVDRLTAEGFSREEVRGLADQFIAKDLGTATDDFIAWARDNRPSS